LSRSAGAGKGWGRVNERGLGQFSLGNPKKKDKSSTLLKDRKAQIFHINFGGLKRDPRRQKGKKENNIFSAYCEDRRSAWGFIIRKKAGCRGGT